jgi:DNA processing protein
LKPDAALFALARAHLPDAVLRALLDAHRDPVGALAAARGGGLRLPDEARVALQNPDALPLDSDLAWLAGGPRRVVAWHDDDYPPLLRHVPSPPPLLFVDGDASLLWHPQVAIVGSRRPTGAGRERAYDFALRMASAGWVVTSGLAQGIDAAAHAGALAAGRTIAVVGTGPDRHYPAENRALQRRIATLGAVVSEHPPGTDALAAHFPTRNRIVAGLSLGTVVIEAALRSGALISARLAGESGREVFAVPGSPDNSLARGCNRLIRDGAALVEEADEIVAALAPVAAELAGSLRGQLGPLPDAAAAGSADGQPDVPGDHSLLWSALGHDPTGLDVLARRTGLTVSVVSSMLLHMELDGRVVAANGRYARRRS